jgi:UPF0271 protein
MVREEVSGSSVARIRFKTAIESGRLKIQSPEKIFITKAREAAANVGDAFWLSETDLQVLALALQLRMQGRTPLVATDDYSIQNVARHLGIEFAPLATLGISRILKWVRYCPACHKKYPSDYKSKKCQVCGTELKRKPLRKTLQKSRKGQGETK